MEDTLHFVKKLGVGSYGSVYHCTDSKLGAIAVKCIPHTTNGLHCILEAAIMTTIQHPNISGTHRVYADETRLILFQELAECDLDRYVQSSPPITYELFLSWTHQLLQATGCLHKQGIIHADIKAANVLYFSDDNIKLADFSLSCKQWRPNERYTGPACTVTHRPLEAYTSRSWSFSLDIWSLGCTLYEIWCGESLFHSQGLDDHPKGDLKRRQREALLHWGKLMGEHVDGYTDQPNSQGALSPVTDCTFRAPKLIERFYTLPRTMQSLVLSMLRLNEAARPSIDDLLSSSLFNDFEVVPYHLEPSNSLELSKQAVRLAQIEIAKWSKCPKVRYTALFLYKRATQIVMDHKAYLCSRIAAKLIYNTASAIVETDLSAEVVLKLETYFCGSIGWKLL